MSDALAAPTDEVLHKLQGRRVIEIGAGDGSWLAAMLGAGIDAIGIDLLPRGSGVIQADHTAADLFEDRDLILIVWPPDGTVIAKWVPDDWRGGVMVVGSFARFTPLDWPVAWQAYLPAGVKGGNEARLSRGPDDERRTE